MGAFKGPLTCTKFYVRGEPSGRYRERFIKTIRLRTFQELSADEDDVEERFGWTAPGAILDLDLDQSKVFCDHYLNLGFRYDRWRLPSTLLKAQLAAAQQEFMQRHGVERIGRKNKDELKQRIVRRLRKKSFPSMRLVDLSWNLDSGVVWFWNQSPKMHERLCALFEQTFQLTLAVQSPFVLASEIGLGEPKLKQLVALEPTWIVPPPMTAQLVE